MHHKRIADPGDELPSPLFCFSKKNINMMQSFYDPLKNRKTFYGHSGQFSNGAS